MLKVICMGQEFSMGTQSYLSYAKYETLKIINNVQQIKKMQRIKDIHLYVSSNMNAIRIWQGCTRVTQIKKHLVLCPFTLQSPY